MSPEIPDKIASRASCPRLCAVLAILLWAAGIFVSQAAPPPVRIEPLGDSITFGALVAGGYRLPLYQLLTNAGFNVEFVGTQTNGEAAGLPNSDTHEGHSGYRIDQIDDGFLGWVNSVSDPDIILLLIGTNDYGQGDDPAHATNRLDHLIGNIVSNRPNAKLVVANLTLRTDAPTTNAMIQTQFNPFVPGLVAKHAALGQQVYFIDMYSLLTASDLGDGLHPNTSGYAKMAAGWFGMVTNLITPLGSTNPPVISRAVGGTNQASLAVTFSKPVMPDATNLANFGLSGGLTVSSATLDPVGQRIVTLVTSPQVTGQSYSVTVGNVRDTTPGHLVIAPATAAAFHGARLRGAFNNVPEAVNYTLVYSLDIPNAASFDSSGVPYGVDYHYAISSFSRVAYYLELQPLNGPLEFAWASMNAFTNDATKIGVPTLGGGAFFQGRVTNLNVFSSFPGVVNGTGLTGGYLEFWPNSYTATNAANVPGASSTTYDWGDDPTPGEYGSMQIFNLGVPQTVFGFDNWANVIIAPTELGIGSSTGADPDWTFNQNGPSYAIKTLQVFVLPATNASPVAISQALGGAGRTNVLVRFNKPVSDASANPAHFNVNGGVSVTTAVLQPNLRDILLTTTTQTALTLYTVSVSGVADRSNIGNVIASGSGAAFTALADAPVFSRVPETSGYRLVYGLALPTANPNWYANAIHYTVDQSAFISQPFDRIAYYLELATTVGGTTNWLYVSANAFTALIGQVGVPVVSSGAVFQQYLTNMNVASSVAGITTGMGLNGNIEFWPGNYSPGNAANIPNASGSTYDFGDQNGGASPSAAYGSMQIHNYAAAQTLFAVNHWGDVSGGSLDVGIGNSTGANPDWTSTGNAGSYAVKNLYVLVRPSSATATTVAPVIVNEPLSHTNMVGTSLTLLVNAIGTTPACQWRFNGTPLAGETNTSLNIPFVNSWQAGNYDLVLANSAGSVTSIVAALSVIVPPPDPATMTGTAVFANGATLLSFTGTPGLTYQVQRAAALPATNWVTILTTNLISPATSFQYADPQPPAGGAYYRLQWTPGE